MSSETRHRTTGTAAAAKDNNTYKSNSSVGVPGPVPVPSRARVVDPDSEDSTWVDAALTAFIVLLMLLAVSYLTTQTLHFGLLGPASTATTRLSFGSRAANPAPVSAPTTSDSPAPSTPAAASLLELENQSQAAQTGAGRDTETATATATGADGKPRKRFRKKKPRGSRTFTLSELSAFDGSDPDKPIYIAVKGHVYDVSAGQKYYGKGSGYNIFAGRDCSRAFLTGCFKERYPGHDLRGLTPEQMKEIDNWLKFYQEHDTYFYVGELVLPEVTENTPLPNEDCSVYDEPGQSQIPTQTQQETQTTNTDPTTQANPNSNPQAIPSEPPAVPAAA